MVAFCDGGAAGARLCRGPWQLCRGTTAGGRLTDAIAEYRQVIRLKPDDAVAHYTLGNVCAQTADLVQAVAIYQEALKLRPEYPEAHNNLGAVLRRLGASMRRASIIVWRSSTARLSPGPAQPAPVLAGSDVAATGGTSAACRSRRRDGKVQRRGSPRMLFLSSVATLMYSSKSRHRCSTQISLGHLRREPFTTSLGG